MDNALYKISDTSGLSINSIYKLYCIILQNNKNTFTPKELAEYYGVTLRSIYRVIENLEASGHAKIIGKKVIGKSGRPTRIIKLDFNVDGILNSMKL